MSASRKKAARRRRRTVTEREGHSPLSTAVRSVLLALPITVATGLLLLFIATALLLTAKDPDRYHTAVGYAAVYLTALIGGFAALRLNRRQAPLLCGLCEGALLLVLLMAIGLFLPTAWKHGNGAALTVLTHACLPLVAVLGALLGTRTARERHRRKRH